MSGQADNSPVVHAADKARELVTLISRMKTKEEFGDDQPEWEDWIDTLGNLIDSARKIEAAFHAETEEQNSPAAVTYRKAALEQQEDGVMEVDEDAVVSLGDDGGAYVECWTWISKAEADLLRMRRDRRGQRRGVGRQVR